MLRGRLALGSVYLCLVCLLVLTPPAATSRRPCSPDVLTKVKGLIIKASDLKLDCKLYTPSIEDYQQKCPSSTMKCFADEIKVLINEWTTVGVRGIRGSKLNEKLGGLAMNLNQTKTESLQCESLQCELLKEEEAENFLTKLELTLVMMNSEFC